MSAGKRNSTRDEKGIWSIGKLERKNGLGSVSGWQWLTKVENGFKIKCSVLY
jgi:hypothetical protein